MDFLSKGFLGTRGDFLSDFLILALAVIVPLLIWSVLLGRGRVITKHHTVMLVIYYILVGYVILYELNLLSRGGIDFLRSKIRMNEIPYWISTGLHVFLGAVALVVGAVAIRQGKRAISESESVFKRKHRFVGWFTVIFLLLTSLTGVMVYYLTFVYISGAS